MPNVNVEDKLYREIKEYCRLNKLTIGAFVNDLLRKNFMVEKYDEMPPFFKKVREEFAPEQFQKEYQGEPEPIKKQEYIKPEVLSVEVKQDEKELAARERARKRIQYL